MDFKIVFLLFTIKAGCYGSRFSEHEMSFYFHHSHPVDFLVNGTIAPVGSHPYMVAIIIGDTFRDFLCGGSLISHRTVLTAAHCIDAVYDNGVLDRTLGVVVGTNLWETGGTVYKFERNVTHPHYVPSLVTNDIGLLITATKVEYTNLVKPVILTYAYIGGGVSAMVTGWGLTASNGTASDALMQIRIDTIDGPQCVEHAEQAVKDLKMRAPRVQPHVQVCTYHSAGLGTCNGDSGSPLVRGADSAQFGVVSWGFPCARGAPDIFTRISAFKDFIETNMVL